MNLAPQIKICDLLSCTLLGSVASMHTSPFLRVSGRSREGGLFHLGLIFPPPFLSPSGKD